MVSAGVEGTHEYSSTYRRSWLLITSFYGIATDCVHSASSNLLKVCKLTRDTQDWHRMPGLNRTMHLYCELCMTVYFLLVRMRQVSPQLYVCMYALAKFTDASGYIALNIVYIPSWLTIESCTHDCIIHSMTV